MEMQRICYFTILIGLASAVAFDRTPLDLKLVRQLTEVGHYDIRSRPVLNVTDKLHIGISIEINRINHLDDKSEVFSWVGYVNVTWNNPHLRWNPDEWDGIEYLLMKEKDMWVPDISILERLDAEVGFTDQKRRLIAVSYTGDVKWFLGGGTIDTPCKLNMRKFPFDSQICGMSVGSYAMSDKEVEISHSNASLIGEVLGKHGMWTVTNFTTDMRIMKYSTKIGDISYKYVYLRIFLRRRSSYYVINIILPCVFISVLMCVVFLIPPDGGDKVSFSVTLLVAFNVIQLVIIDMMPQTSESIPIIAIYVTSLLALSALCIPLSVFIITIYNQGDRNIPRWLAQLILPTQTHEYNSTNVHNHHEKHLTSDCMPDPVGNSMEHKNDMESRDEHVRMLGDIRMELRKLRVDFEERSLDGCRLEAWRHAARRLDSLFLKLFAPVLIIHTLLCLGFMMIS